MRFYPADLVIMKFYFLFLLLGEKEERHTVEKGEDRRKKRGIIRLALSKHWLRTSRVRGSSGLKERQMDWARTHNLNIGRKCLVKVFCCTLSSWNRVWNTEALSKQQRYPQQQRYPHRCGREWGDQRWLLKGDDA